MKTNIEIREDFPIFKNREYAYLDSAATSQRPQCVLDAMANFDLNRNANPNRGAYELAIEATSDYNEAREVVAKFINAKLPEEVLFTKNASEALNLVAFSYGLDNVKAGEEIVISIMEHHSALVPWQRVADDQCRTYRAGISEGTDCGGRFHHTAQGRHEEGVGENPQQGRKEIRLHVSGL